MQRPFAITLIVIWFILAGLGSIGSGTTAALMTGALIAFLGAMVPGLDALGMAVKLLGVVILVLGVARIAVGVGLMSGGKPWARTWGLALGVTSAILGFALGLAPSLMGGAGSLLFAPLLSFISTGVIDGLAAWYLTTAEAKQWTRDFTPPLPPVFPPAPAPEVKYVPVPIERVGGTQMFGVPPAPTAWLIPQVPGKAGDPLPLMTGKNVVGRDPQLASLVLHDPTVSGEHAAVVFENGQFYISDLASRNKVKVNGQLVQKRMLVDGDRVKLGNEELVFKRV